MKATYNITTNKIKFAPPAERLTPEQDKERRACNFVWYPGQKVFCAVWSPSAEDWIKSFGIEIEADDTPDDVEARVERFAGYADDAERSADSAREYANVATTEKRTERALNRAASEAERAEYWTHRIAASIAHAQRKDRPDVISRRIKGIEADLRKHTKNHEEALKWLARWQDVTPGDRDTAVKLANYGSFYVTAPTSDNPTRQTSAWNALDTNQITPAEARTAALAHFSRSLDYTARWMEHLKMRIEYERAFLDNVGGDPVAKLANVKKGDSVMWRRELCEVLKVNKTTMELKVPSRHWLKTGMKVDKTEIQPAPSRDETARALAAEFRANYPELSNTGYVEEVDPESGYASEWQGKPSNHWGMKISGAWYDVYTAPIGALEVLGVVPA